MPLTLVLLALGLLGSILMFAGDMLLYFTPGAYDMDARLTSVLRRGSCAASSVRRASCSQDASRPQSLASGCRPTMPLTLRPYATSA